MGGRWRGRLGGGHREAWRAAGRYAAKAKGPQPCIPENHSSSTLLWLRVPPSMAAKQQGLGTGAGLLLSWSPFLTGQQSIPRL